MNDKIIEQNIQLKVLEKLKSGNVRMRPKLYFIFRLLIISLVVFIALGVSAFVMSFAFFSVHESGEQFLLGFGVRGIITFLLLFPWLSILLDISIFFLLEWLLRRFRFAYRVSLLSVFVGILTLSIILGITVNLTPLHGILLNQAENGGLPVIGKLYESIRDSHSDKGVFRGTISLIQGSTIMIIHNDKDHDDDDGTHIVILPSGGHPALQVGDRVYVYGISANGAIEARGIQKLAPEQ